MLSVCVCTRIIKYMPTEFNVRSDFCTVSYGNVLLIEEAFAVLYFYLCIFFFLHICFRNIFMWSFILQNLWF